MNQEWINHIENIIKLEKDGKEIFHEYVNKIIKFNNFDNPELEYERMNEIKKNPSSFKFMLNPSESIIDLAINEDGKNIIYLDKPNIELVKKAIISKPELLKTTFNEKDFDEKCKKELIDKNPHIIKYLSFTNLEIQKQIINKNPLFFQFIKNPYREIIEEAFYKAPSIFQYIKNPSYKIKLKALEYDGHNIQYIKNPDKKLILKALKQNGTSIKYIKNPTLEMKICALKSNGDAIRYICNPPEYLKLMAVKQKGKSIQYINNPSNYIKIQALINDLYAMEYIKEDLNDYVINEVIFKLIKMNVNNKNMYSYIQNIPDDWWCKLKDNIKLKIIDISSELIERFSCSTTEMQIRAIIKNRNNFYRIKEPTFKTIEFFYNHE